LQRSAAVSRQKNHPWLQIKSSFVGVAGEAVEVVVRTALRLVWVLDY
jgi:hypothetical protein